jgi:hypothetical protein
MAAKTKKTPPAKKPARPAPAKAKRGAKKKGKKKRHVLLYIPKPEERAKVRSTGAPPRPRIQPWPCAGRSGSRSSAVVQRISPPLKVSWRHKLAAPSRAQPVVSEDGVVYVADREGELRALDVETGKRTFKLRTDPILGASPAWPLVVQKLVPGDRVPVSAAACVYEWHLFFGDDEGIFYCLRRGDAEVIWRRSSPRRRQ